MDMYVKFTDINNCETLNNLMFTEFVYENGQYKFPFSAPTNRYCDGIKNPNNNTWITVLDFRMTDFASRNPIVANLISVQITYDEAVAEGWFNM